MDEIDSVIRELEEEEHDIVKALVQKRICMTLAMKGHQGQEKNTTTTGKSNAKQALREKNQPQPENWTSPQNYLKKNWLCNIYIVRENIRCLKKICMMK